MGVSLIKMVMARKNFARFACDLIIEPSFMKSCIHHCSVRTTLNEDISLHLNFMHDPSYIVCRKVYNQDTLS